MHEFIGREFSFAFMTPPPLPQHSNKKGTGTTVILFSLIIFTSTNLCNISTPLIDQIN